MFSKFYKLGNWFLNHFGSVCAPQNDRKDTNQRFNVQFQFSFFRSNSCSSRVKSNFANNLQIISSNVSKNSSLKIKIKLCVLIYYDTSLFVGKQASCCLEMQTILTKEGDYRKILLVLCIHTGWRIFISF